MSWNGFHPFHTKSASSSFLTVNGWSIQLLLCMGYWIRVTIQAYKLIIGRLYKTYRNDVISLRKYILLLNTLLLPFFMFIFCIKIRDRTAHFPLWARPHSRLTDQRQLFIEYGPDFYVYSYGRPLPTKKKIITFKRILTW